MPTRAKIILSSRTQAGSSDTFHVGPGERKTVMIAAASGLIVGEWIDLQISADGGLSWTDVYNEGVQVRMDAVSTVLVIDGPGTYRMDKDVTTNTVGIFLAGDSVNDI